MSDKPLVELGAIPTSAGWLVVMVPRLLVERALSTVLDIDSEIKLNWITFKLKRPDR